MKTTELLRFLPDSQDFLAMKRIANQRKDRLDIEALEKILRGENPNE